MAMEPHYPEIEVVLVGAERHGGTILDTMRRALRDGGVAPEEIDKFYEEALAGDFDHLLRTCMTWVTVN